MAGRHSTSLYNLFSKEVAALINKPGTIGLRVSFASFAKAANGLGVIASDLTQVFEKLTLRQYLCFTTMLPWSGSISSKSLTREWRAWCPDCYEACALQKGQLYDQLLWSSQSVTNCPRHKRRLADEWVEYFSIGTGMYKSVFELLPWETLTEVEFGPLLDEVMDSVLQPQEDWLVSFTVYEIVPQGTIWRIGPVTFYDPTAYDFGEGRWLVIPQSQANKAVTFAMVSVTADSSEEAVTTAEFRLDASI